MKLSLNTWCYFNVHLTLILFRRHFKKTSFYGNMNNRQYFIYIERCFNVQLTSITFSWRGKKQKIIKKLSISIPRCFNIHLTSVTLNWRQNNVLLCYWVSFTLFTFYVCSVFCFVVIRYLSSTFSSCYKKI